MFLIYGATGFVGEAIARLAVQSGLRPILAGRNADGIARLAAELGVRHRAFELGDAIDRELTGVKVVLHCAGPYVHTFKPMMEACLRTRTHYLDLSGEIPVYEGIAARDGESIVLADDPAGFARAVGELVRDPGRAASIADRAARLVRERYGWEGVLEPLVDLYRAG